MHDRARCCCFTGHRPEKLTADEKTVKALLGRAIDAAIDAGYDTFISGMARGVDLWAAELVLERRAAGEPVKLIAALPYPSPTNGTGSAHRRRATVVLTQADAVEVICIGYTKGCFHKRNAWMISRASRRIAVYDGCAGGARDTIARAEKAGLEIVMIKLEDSSISSLRKGRSLSGGLATYMKFMLLTPS